LFKSFGLFGQKTETERETKKMGNRYKVSAQRILIVGMDNAAA